MKATGIVRRIDDLGRVVIPKEMRRTLGIKEGDPMEIALEGSRIILNKYSEGCVITGSTDDLITFGGKQYSREIVRQLARAAGV